MIEEAESLSREGKPDGNEFYEILFKSRWHFFWLPSRKGLFLKLDQAADPGFRDPDPEIRDLWHGLKGLETSKSLKNKYCDVDVPIGIRFAFFNPIWEEAFDT